MFANKIVELFLVVVSSLMIAHAQDCNSLKTCLKSYVARFGNMKFDSISSEGLKKLYEIICSDKDALAGCYNQQNIQDCRKLSGNGSDFKKQLTDACARTTDLLETSGCIVQKATVSRAIADCSNKIKGDICSISKYIGCIESAMKDECPEKIGLFPAIKYRLSFCDAETADNQPAEETVHAEKTEEKVESANKTGDAEKTEEKVESANKTVDAEKTEEKVESANKNQCAVFCSGSKILFLLCFLLFLIQIVK